MRLHDKDRPRIGGLPAWLPSGRAVVPSLQITVLAEGQIEIAGYVPTAFNQFSRRTCVGHVSRIEFLLRDWAEDPEATARQLWGWDHQANLAAGSPIVLGASAKTNLNPEDLGL